MSFIVYNSTVRVCDQKSGAFPSQPLDNRCELVPQIGPSPRQWSSPVNEEFMPGPHSHPLEGASTTSRSSPASVRVVWPNPTTRATKSLSSCSDESRQVGVLCVDGSRISSPLPAVTSSTLNCHQPYSAGLAVTFRGCAILARSRTAMPGSFS